jgi:CRP-like cAMP-binding protein
MKSIAEIPQMRFRKAIEAFVIFTDEEWAIFSEHFYSKQLKKKELLVSDDKTCTEVCFILAGSFRFYFIKDGMEISNYFCFAGELISSYMSFLKQKPGISNIEAMEDAELLCFSYNSLQQLLNDERMAFKMERFGRKVAEYLICCFEERVSAFILQSPEERYRHLVENQPDLLQRIPQHYIANYLGITPVSLSRIRKRVADMNKKRKSVA